MFFYPFNDKSGVMSVGSLCDVYLNGAELGR
jgi:hypothetical protein